jgi:hypothetical protein
MMWKTVEHGALDYRQQTLYLTPYFKLHPANNVIYSIKQYFVRLYGPLETGLTVCALYCSKVGFG